MLSRYGIFCGVIEHKSFTRTAEKLGYSQSAVSQAVRALELDDSHRPEKGWNCTDSRRRAVSAIFSADPSGRTESGTQRTGDERSEKQCCADRYVHQREPYLFTGTYDGI